MRNRAAFDTLRHACLAGGPEIRSPRDYPPHAPKSVPTPREDQIIDTLTKTLIACTLLLTPWHSNAIEAIEEELPESYLYCGKLLWPAEREDYLPFPEGIEIGYSSHPSLAQAVEQQEKHSLRFAYEDMALTQRIMQEAVAMIGRQGANEVCLEARTVEAANSGLPLAISPLANTDGQVIFEPSAERRP